MKKITIATGILVTLLLAAASSFAQTQSRDDILKEIDAKRAELGALEKRFLSPSEEDKATYAEFLRQRNTGLIRLLPREKYDTYSQKETTKGLTTRGGGAYYSFSRLTHEYGFGSDIELAQGYLSTGFAGADYGIMTSLGDTPLESVTLESAAFLATYAPADDLPKARIEQRKWGEGATVEATSYRRRLLAKKDSTYLLRSVNYGDSDVLVAFRVVRIDDDDESAIILWKLLKKYPTPRLAQN
jgi:hypothetical protein